MMDTRFSTVVDDIEQLLDLVDIDEVGDIETLLMFLLTRPVGVNELWEDDGDDAGLEVVLGGNGESRRLVFGFPLRVIDMARTCAVAARELGPYTANGLTADDALDIAKLDEEALDATLQEALGSVRIFSALEGGA